MVCPLLRHRRHLGAHRAVGLTFLKVSFCNEFGAFRLESVAGHLLPHLLSGKGEADGRPELLFLARGKPSSPVTIVGICPPRPHFCTRIGHATLNRIEAQHTLGTHTGRVQACLILRSLNDTVHGRRYRP